MHEYQKRAIITSIKRKQNAIFLDTGLGKTIISLTIIDQLLKRRWIKRALIVCTKKAMYSSWRQQAKLWEHTQYLTFNIIHGSAGIGKSEYVKRRNLLAPSHICLINYEGLPWLAKTLREMYRGKAFPFDCIFYDESTKMKHSTTQRFKKFKPFMGKFRYRYPMTGTPAPNGLLDLYGQMYVMDLGASLGSRFESFRERFFMRIDEGSVYRPRKGSVESISKRIAGKVTHMKKQDYLELPPLIHNKMEIDLPDKLRGQYDELENTFFIELENAAIEAFSKASLSMKLRQFLQGKMYAGEGEHRKVVRAHTEKLQVLSDMADSQKKMLEGIGNCIIAYNFRFEREDLHTVFPGAPAIDGRTTDAQAEDYVTRWNKKEIPVLLYNPASDPHGLNLQFGGNNLLWYSLTWNLEHYIQLIDRLHRQQQDKPVYVHSLMFRDTIETVIHNALSSKEATQDGLLAALKVYRKEKV